MGFHHIGQAGLKLLTLGDPSASSSQSAGITGENFKLISMLQLFLFPGWLPELQERYMVDFVFLPLNCSFMLSSYLPKPDSDPSRTREQEQWRRREKEVENILLEWNC